MEHETLIRRVSTGDSVEVLRGIEVRAINGPPVIEALGLTNVFRSNVRNCEGSNGSMSEKPHKLYTQGLTWARVFAGADPQETTQVRSG